ncbi:MAG: glycosyltransferase family 1 protein [Patescibacteria group bacterium]|jgi:glycosyltransferase involved in cell wall biosynthesis
MIIGIDAREGIKDQRAGKGEYVYQLVGRLIQNRQHQFKLFLDADLPLEWKQANVQPIVFKTNALLWQKIMFWYLELWRPVDVYFSPTSLILPALVRRVPVVTAVMDFVSFILPERHKLKALILERIWMRPALRYSQKIIAISEHTKQDAIRLFKVNPAKIAVTPLAPSFGSSEKPYPLPYTKIILGVGTLEPRKNLERLVAAFNLIKAEVQEATLVLVGRWGWQSDGIKKAIATSPYGKDIHILEDVNNTQKKSIYQQAAVLAFSSLYEGFGLPLLEAMACGTPVVAANTSSVPEVVGEAALLVDPASITELATAIQKVLQDDRLAADLKSKGQAQAQLFSWEATATQTLQVLMETQKKC